MSSSRTRMIQLTEKLEEILAALDGLLRTRTDSDEVRASLAEAVRMTNEAVRAAREEEADREKLRERISTLEDSLLLNPTLVRSGGLYWQEGDKDPWCPRCWEKDHVALHLNHSDVMAGRICVCPRCEYSVNLDHARPPTDWSF